MPIAFLLSAFFPPLIIIILVIGGLYLAYEGAEKIHEFVFPHKDHHVALLNQEFTEEEILEHEKGKIKAAILTDFILSVEIVIIALGTVIGKPLIDQIIVVSIIAILATVGVYGIVALIVRMDEFGYKLIALNERDDSFSDKIGHVLVKALPKIIKSLTVIGTIALLMVSGGIFSHYVPFLHGIFPSVPSIITEFLMGLVIGFIVLGIVNLIKKIFGKKKVEAPE